MKSTLFEDKNITVISGDKFKLSKFDTAYTANLEKTTAKANMETLKARLSELQDKLFAQDKFSLLLVFQAMDAAGKDGTIREVMSGVNPQGCQVVSFKAPSANELDHDFLWRCYKELPERGRIGIFNRSYYEEVLVTKVHPEYIMGQRLPNVKSEKDINSEFWRERYESIQNFEKHLTENGTVILKFFLNVSKEKQKERFLDRIEELEKNWKFSYKDLQERKLWDKYQLAYQDAIANTSASYAPWFIIPADKNWARNYMVCEIIVDALEKMNLSYPEVSDEMKELLIKGKQELLNEK